MKRIIGGAADGHYALRCHVDAPDGSRYALSGLPSLPPDTVSLDALFEELMALEVLFLNAAQAAPGVARFEYTETILDEDRVDGFKLMAMRVVVEG